MTTTKPIDSEDPVPFRWGVFLEPLCAQRHRWIIETNEGHIREAQITKIEYRTIEIDQRTVRVPISIELEGDSLDYIPFVSIISIKRA